MCFHYICASSMLCVFTTSVHQVCYVFSLHLCIKRSICVFTTFVHQVCYMCFHYICASGILNICTFFAHERNSLLSPLSVYSFDSMTGCRSNLFTSLHDMIRTKNPSSSTVAKPTWLDKYINQGKAVAFSCSFFRRQWYNGTAFSTSLSFLLNTGGGFVWRSRLNRKYFFASRIKEVGHIIES